MVELYRNTGLEIYEQAHYGRGEHLHEVAQLLTWYRRSASRVLDLGCSGGLHALEFARKGHQVVGIDIELSAVERARERARQERLAVQFHVLDLEEASLDQLGTFELIYSIGNVLSHVPRRDLPAVLQKIRGCCGADGLFLFDLLIIGPHFPEEVHEAESGIIWKRTLDRSTGKIDLQGTFTDFALIQNFLVWGYAVDEVLRLLHRSGFAVVGYAADLDFSCAKPVPESPVCLKFLAQAQGGQHATVQHPGAL